MHLNKILNFFLRTFLQNPESQRQIEKKIKKNTALKYYFIFTVSSLDIASNIIYNLILDL